ncbi:MAG: cyclase family protein [Planctomycetales bacterium]|nr:cyclase family protein [Planctomycetales bacterium]
MTVRRGLVIGAGYFSDFHLDAWYRLPGAEIVCVCDLDRDKARHMANKHGVPEASSDVAAALDRQDLDFVDIVTPPRNRIELVRQAIERGLPTICQKPLADDFAAAREIVDLVRSHDVPFMVHENFRFQPWYREMKRLLDDEAIGSKLHSINVRSRMGDGWGPEAYLSRQPYFRTMPRLLVHETGVHFVDTFRFLAGEIVQCQALLRRLNPDIVAEDAGQLTFRFENGAIGVWDANRYNESLSPDFRYTFGEMVIEADGGSLWLDSDGTITIKKLGQSPTRHTYDPSRLGFAGDCVAATQQHFLDVLDGKCAAETSPTEYLKTLQVVEALYVSSSQNRPITVTSNLSKRQPVIVDLSLPVSAAMRGVQISSNKSLEEDGWNATTLSLYSHAGTHMDAPKHFLPDGATLDQQELHICCGPARIVNLAGAQPRQLITVEDVTSRLQAVSPGERLLFRTDWYHRFGTDAYRDQLPRISLELAQWLVAQQVALIGVEPPSVADVNNMRELTEVHQTLFRGGVVIVEGLANLDRINSDIVEFIALPLNIVGGDGCPVRAIAIDYKAPW